MPTAIKLAPIAPELRNVTRIEVKGSRAVSRAVWRADGTSESDAQPFTLVNPENWPTGANRPFLFWVEDCYSPPLYLVAVESFRDSDDGFADAYEVFLDFAADRCHLLIEEPDLKDYLDGSGEYTGDYTSDGRPVETESIRGEACRIVRIDCE